MGIGGTCSVLSHSPSPNSSAENGKNLTSDAECDAKIANSYVSCCYLDSDSYVRTSMYSCLLFFFKAFGCCVDCFYQSGEPLTAKSWTPRRQRQLLTSMARTVQKTQKCRAVLYICIYIYIYDKPRSLQIGHGYLIKCHYSIISLCIPLICTIAHMPKTSNPKAKTLNLKP